VVGYKTLTQKHQNGKKIEDMSMLRPGRLWRSDGHRGEFHNEAL